MSYLQPKASVLAITAEISKQPFLTVSRPCEQTQKETQDICNRSLGNLCQMHRWTDSNSIPLPASAI